MEPAEKVVPSTELEAQQILLRRMESLEAAIAAQYTGAEMRQDLARAVKRNYRIINSLACFIVAIVVGLIPFDKGAFTANIVWVGQIAATLGGGAVLIPQKDSGSTSTASDQKQD